MDVRMATALAGAVTNVSAFCAQQGISRQTFYKWRRRFAEGGVEGLQERSRRPVASVNACPAFVEDRIVYWRKRLIENGADCGADSILWQLTRDPELLLALAAAGDPMPGGVPGGMPGGMPGRMPGRATIWRVLKRRGLIVAEPKKRPRSSLRRFTFARPNDCWQSDWTQWVLADGTQVAIAATLDDHSRYLVAMNAGLGDGTTEQVWAVFQAGIGECGIPARSLTDNGLVYSGRRRGFEVASERNLRALGVQPIASTPGHPQTCGKIERFWQTLKRWLRARPAPATLIDLNALLGQFRAYYNHQRPHRALRGKTPNATPAEAFHATVKARPAQSPIPATVFVDHGAVTGKGVTWVGTYQIHVGARWAGHHTTAIRDGDHVVIFSGTHLLRDLQLDPTRRYQAAAPGTPRTRYRYREPITP